MNTRNSKIYMAHDFKICLNDNLIFLYRINCNKLDKLYILVDGCLRILYIDNGALVKSFVINAISFGFYSDQTIAGLIANKSSLYSDSGDFIRDIGLKINKDFHLSENGKFSI